ncbi:MAG: elongation factor G [Actinomycetota bacterium]
MKRYSGDAIRNVAIAGHQGAGKTSLAEAVLFDTGAIDRLGRVDDGAAKTDFDPEEQRRQISINLALAPVEWKGCKINLLDSPGYLDFQGEVASAMRVADAAVIVVPGPSGVEVGAETAWELATEHQLPKLIFVNKMDRENADYGRVMESIRAAFGNRCVPIQAPIGQETRFVGVVDVLRQTSITGAGKDVRVGPVPAECEARVQELREALMECAAEADDELLEKYLGGEPLSDEELSRGVVAAVKGCGLVPVLFGSAAVNLGIQPLLDALVELAPSPAEKGADESKPTAALVFKTLSDPYVGKLSYFRVAQGVLKGGGDVHNTNREHDERLGQLFVLRGKHQEPVAEVAAGDIAATAKLGITVTGDTLCEKGKSVQLEGIEFPYPSYEKAIVALSKADEDKMGPALARLAEEDPAFRFHRDPETGQTVISGQGDTHLNIVIERLKRFGANVHAEEVKIPYRETIHGTARVQGRHKKQTGGRGQFGDCWVKFEPLPRGSGYEYVDAIVGGSIPRQYIPAVDKGLQESLDHGILGGFRVVDIRATCDDGSFHDVDSSEMAFRQAAHLAFRAGMEKAGAVLLEPVMNIEVVIPEQYMGDIISDMNTKRGRILGMEPVGNGKQLVRAVAPMAEVQSYAIDLRSIARGRGKFKTEFSHYEEVPTHIAQGVIEKAKREREEHG